MQFAICNTLFAADGPLSPSDALKSFQIEEGLKIELIAAEPLVVDPVAVAFDEQGRMFVAEDRGYPVGPGEGKPPVGVVALLEDTDSDGVYDKRAEFATGLSFPNGVMCWKGGVIVTCSPDILYLKDTDGDGKADVRQVLLTGFSTKASTQLRVSHPTLGLDGWVYVTSGLVGGKIVSPSHPQMAPVEAISDFRFLPDGSAVEAVGGKAQFGQSFDDFGRRFVCDNRQPAQHVVMLPRQLARNPHLGIGAAVQSVAAGDDIGKVFPLTADTTTASFIPALLRTPHAGNFTSACGLVIFRGTGLGPGHDGNIFTCEPAQNLVQRQVMRPDGASFVSRRPYEGKEFLASTDSWFRPVFAANGPGGALYICDMYRKVLDHPDYLPKETHARMDFRAGDDKGRIYRIVSTNSRGRKPARPHTSLEASEGWERDTARRLILERLDPSIISQLKEGLNTSFNAHAAVAGIWMLEGIAALDDAALEATIRHTEPGVREQAVAIIEQRLIAPNPDAVKKWLPLLTAMAGDKDARVRFQVALALGAISDPAVIQPLAQIAALGLNDRWTRAAVLGGIAPDPQGFVEALIAACQESPDALAEIGHDVGRMFGAGQPVEKSLWFFLRVTNDQAADTVASNSALAGLAEGLRSRGFGGGARPPLMALVETKSPDGEAARQRLAGLSERWGEIALSAKPQAAVAVALLGELDYAAAGARLESLLVAGRPVEIQLAAVKAMSRFNEPAVGALLVSAPRWGGYSPTVRETVVQSLLSNSRQLPPLLDAMEKGEIPIWALDSARRTQLMNHPDAAIKARAAALFESAKVADRRKVYEEYKSVLAMKADPLQGRAVYQKICIACHTHAGEGAAVGPDLTGVRNQPAEALLLHIIIPEQEIYPAYTQYLVLTKDGKTLAGLIAGETQTAVTLRFAGGQQETLQRDNIASMISLNLSLMPQEMEKTMTHQELADLIAFLKK